MEEEADKTEVKCDRGKRGEREEREKEGGGERERERETQYLRRYREIEIERSNKASGIMSSSSFCSGGTENAAFAFGFLYEKRAISPDGGLSK